MFTANLPSYGTGVLLGGVSYRKMIFRHNYIRPPQFSSPRFERNPSGVTNNWRPLGFTMNSIFIQPTGGDLTLTGSFSIGGYGSFNLQFTNPDAKLTGGGHFHLKMSAPIPLFESIWSKIDSFNLRSAHTSLRFFDIVGGVGSFNFKSATPLIRFTGYKDSIGSFNFIVPIERIEFSKKGNFYCFVVNTETLANWTYENFNFNSFAQMLVNGVEVTLAADENGIVTLTGQTDRGDNINASFITAPTDFGEDGLKSLEDARLNYMGGPLIFQTHHDGVLSGAHTVSASTEHENRSAWMDFQEKGIRQRYWGVKISNSSGSYFNVNRITLIPMLEDRTTEEDES